MKPASEGLRVAAFTALRGEIDRRSNAQLQLTTISLVGFTTLAAIVLGSDPIPYELLLLVPLLSIATGLLWLDHDRRIREIGDYIRDDIFAGASGSFEERADELEIKSTARVQEFLVPTIAVFVGPAVASLLWTYQEREQMRAPFLWWTGLTLTVLYCLYFVWVMNRNAKTRGRHTGTLPA